MCHLSIRCDDALMRATLDIDDSMLAEAKEIAGARNSSAGAVMSDLARKRLSLTSDHVSQRKPRFPVFTVPVDARRLTSAAVKAILSDEGLPSRR
jgi:Arc/MetJ family transcription regulator